MTSIVPIYNCLSGHNSHVDRFVYLSVLFFCSLAVLDPRVGHTVDVLSPFIPVLCHSD